MDMRIPKGDVVQVVGPPRSGKTWYVSQVLMNKNQLIQDGHSINHVCVIYKNWQDVYSKLKKRGVVQQWIMGMPSAEDFVKIVEPYKSSGCIVVLDDCLSDLSSDLLDIVTVRARHNNVTLFMIQQSLFPKARFAKDISLHVKYLFLFKNPRDNSQFARLAYQLRPHDSDWLSQVYADVTDEPYGCLIIDLRPECKEHLRFRSHMLPSQWPMRAYKKRGVYVHDENT